MIKKTTKPKDKVAFEKIMEPVKTKFGIKNIMQAIVGAVILAIPIGFTQEVWELGETLPFWNIIIILILSLGFIGIFAYRNFSKNIPNFYWSNLIKRIFWSYFIAFFIVTFPSSLSAAIASNLK